MDERDGSARRVQQVDSPRASSLVPSSYFSPSMMMMMMMLFRGGAPKARLCVQFHDFIPRHYLWRGAMIKLTTAPFSFCVCVRERESARTGVAQHDSAPPCGSVTSQWPEWKRCRGYSSSVLRLENSHIITSSD